LRRRSGGPAAGQAHDQSHAGSHDEKDGDDPDGRSAYRLVEPVGDGLTQAGDGLGHKRLPRFRRGIAGLSQHHCWRRYARIASGLSQFLEISRSAKSRRDVREAYHTYSQRGRLFTRTLRISEMPVCTHVEI
jgi:hypothetical protein